jgi:thioredoxin reductase (NADPH)
VAGQGDGHLETLTIADRDSGVTEEVSSSWLFIFIGAIPRTEWLGPDVARDDKGFIITGHDLLAAPARPATARNTKTAAPGHPPDPAARPAR